MLLQDFWHRLFVISDGVLICRVMIGKSTNRYPALKRLIDRGVPVSALLLGQRHYTVTGHCDVNMLTQIVGNVSETYGPECLEHNYDLLCGLWADCYLHPLGPCRELLATRQESLEEMFDFFHDLGKISDQSYWPQR